MAWRGFWMTLLGTAAGLAAVLYAAVAIVDPYDSLRFSPPFDRAPVTTNQRFSYPAIARKARFDSVVIGSSTSRLLRPAKLDEVFGGSFANLAMNSATATEQSRILALFARHHPEARTAIIGIDNVWCYSGQSFPRFTSRPFPPWLYDEDPWNDLIHLFNLPSLEEAGRQAAFLLGLRPKKYGRNGYANFLPPIAEYDLARVRQGLYGEDGPHRPAPVTPPVVLGEAERAAWRFPIHGLLRDMLAALPEATRKIVIFVPYHALKQPVPGSRSAAFWRECKRRIAKVADDFANSFVLDFMIPSEITWRDESYWDYMHTTVEVGDRVSELIAQGVRTRCGVGDLMSYLSARPGACMRPPGG